MKLAVGGDSTLFNMYMQRARDSRERARAMVKRGWYDNAAMTYASARHALKVARAVKNGC